MCDADAGILTYVWVKGWETPLPDFSVQHKCRDFYALKNWVAENQLFLAEGQSIERLPGASELDSRP
ncbi:tat pathway signal sequence protein [Rutstroemia sp. NJR-2017a BBW]|nr:tat pathway signal sequence protein [Rutstroemia sp. NJR-2017a BBW]